MEKMGEDETTREWWKLTDPTQIPLETRKEGEWWASMEEWTHVADKVVPSSTIQERYVYIAQIKDNMKKQLKQLIVHNTHNLEDELKRVNFQNKGMYVKDNRLYTYFEYYGNNFEQDIDKLENTPEYQQWWQKIKSLLEPPSDTEKLWVPMEEVFHTD
jgi:L-rhamnose mutarotase